MKYKECSQKLVSAGLGGAGAELKVDSALTHADFSVADVQNKLLNLLEFSLGPNYTKDQLLSKLTVSEKYTEIKLNAREVLDVPEISWFFKKYLDWFKLKRLYFEYSARDWTPYLFAIFKYIGRKLMVFLLQRKMEVFFPSLIKHLRKRCDTIISNLRFSARRELGVRTKRHRGGSKSSKLVRQKRRRARLNLCRTVGFTWTVRPTAPYSVCTRKSTGHVKLHVWKIFAKDRYESIPISRRIPVEKFCFPKNSYTKLYGKSRVVKYFVVKKKYSYRKQAGTMKSVPGFTKHQVACLSRWQLLNGFRKKFSCCKKFGKRVQYAKRFESVAVKKSLKAREVILKKIAKFKSLILQCFKMENFDSGFLYWEKGLALHELLIDSGCLGGCFTVWHGVSQPTVETKAQTESAPTNFNISMTLAEIQHQLENYGKMDWTDLPQPQRFRFLSLGKKSNILVGKYKLLTVYGNQERGVTVTPLRVRNGSSGSGTPGVSNDGLTQNSEAPSGSALPYCHQPIVCPNDGPFAKYFLDDGKHPTLDKILNYNTALTKLITDWRNLIDKFEQHKLDMDITHFRCTAGLLNIMSFFIVKKFDMQYFYFTIYSPLNLFLLYRKFLAEAKRSYSGELECFEHWNTAPCH